MTAEEFVPVNFDPPTSFTTDQFHLEPLGPQHNQADHAAWMSSIDHIRSTPGYPDGNWPPPGGMTLEENLADLRRHADDFTRRAGFTFTVLDPGDHDVIGCVYLYPSASEEYDVTCSPGSGPTDHTPRRTSRRRRRTLARHRLALGACGPLRSLNLVEGPARVATPRLLGSQGVARERLE